MTFNEKEIELNHYILEHIDYTMCFWRDWNYNFLKKVNCTITRRGRASHTVNECVIMADTETSKTAGHESEVYDNYVVAWTISIRAAGCNIATLYGTRPDEHIECISKIMDALRGDWTYVFYHNLSYDWVFLRKFYFEKFGYPDRQLNTKPHYPISIQFENGLILRDSLILAQRSLQRWAADLDVEHKKACGKWQYDKIRTQHETFTADELTYIEHDTLAGVECIDALRATLGKHISTMPYTATGIVRERFRKVAKKNRGREWFLRQCLDYEFVRLSERVYHGGYTHQNRFMKSDVINSLYTGGDPVQCYDLASSYPFALISEKYPAGKFHPYHDCKPDVILKAAENYSFMFVIDLYDVRLKDSLFPMPLLQYSKAEMTVNEVMDNGRILAADFVRIPLCEVDLKLIAEQYTYNEEYTECKNVIFSGKQYLPKWFTDFVYSLFHDKTMLKGGDPVLYSLSKSMLNSCYGMCCQHVMQNGISEDYDTGEYITVNHQDEENYQKYLDNINTFLPYQVGIWCTSYAMKNLFELSQCLNDVHDWIYTDTDSCYGFNWNVEKIEAYNQKRIDLMHDRGYEGIEHNGRIYYLGIAELDKECTEFKGIHSKCYCYRDTKGELHITVAGVPKSGVKCLGDDINNFTVGFTFPGTETGKLTHTHIFTDRIEERDGILYGDSVNLSPCDYVIGDINTITWEMITSEDIEVINYEYK